MKLIIERNENTELSRNFPDWQVRPLLTHRTGLVGSIHPYPILLARAKVARGRLVVEVIAIERLIGTLRHVCRRREERRTTRAADDGRPVAMAERIERRSAERRRFLLEAVGVGTVAVARVVLRRRRNGGVGVLLIVAAAGRPALSGAAGIGRGVSPALPAPEVHVVVAAHHLRAALVRSRRQKMLFGFVGNRQPLGGFPVFSKLLSISTWGLELNIVGKRNSKCERAVARWWGTLLETGRSKAEDTRHRVSE